MHLKPLSPAQTKVLASILLDPACSFPEEREQQACRHLLDRGLICASGAQGGLVLTAEGRKYIPEVAARMLLQDVGTFMENLLSRAGRLLAQAEEPKFREGMEMAIATASADFVTRLKQDFDDVTLRNSRTVVMHAAGFSGFIDWFQRCSQQITELPPGGCVPSFGDATIFELSSALSASFNLGYAPDVPAMYLAAGADEFDWLSAMPLREIVIAGDSVLIVIEGAHFGEGDAVGPMVLKVITTRPKLWRSCPSQLKEIGLAKVREGQPGSAASIEALAKFRIPLRFIQ